VLAPSVVAADHGLAQLARRIDLLLDVTPVNADEAWEASVAVGHRGELPLRYRPISCDPDAVRADLENLAIGEVEDPAIRRLLADKRTELCLQADLVEARGTDRFLPLSMALYDTADDPLVAMAEELLDRLPASDRDVPVVTPDAFAARARLEVEAYRERLPGFAGTVSVRDDVPSLMVVQRELFVGTDSWIPVHRQEALIHHEVGTHLLTAETGGSQPLVLLEQGLAGWDETQEALAVLSEHLVGGLDAERVRTLAGRAVAARLLSDGAGFPDLFAALHERFGFPERQAWTIAMRFVRGGGFTKDVIYLRGLADLVRHLSTGGSLEPLLVGKVHLRHVDDVEALLEQGVLRPPVVLPRWLEVPGAAERLADLRHTPVATWPVA
jgi:uncharacterized protein (TIGR02421 family)